MAEVNNECHLNQTFYGPTIPPVSQSHASLFPTARASTKFNAYTLLCISFKIITIILIILGVIVLTLWLIFQPQSLKAYADNATLSIFKLSSPGNSSLNYKLSVKLNLRNPNRKYSFYYERLNALAFYDGYQFAYAGSLRHYQGRKSWMSLDVSFEGRSSVATDSVRKSFERQKGEGFFYVRVKIYASVRLKMILIKSEQFKPDVVCNLRLPVPSNDTSLAAGFNRTECEVINFS